MEGEGNTSEEDGEKEIDWDLAHRIALCEQLMVFVEAYKPKEAKAAVVAEQPAESLDIEGAVVVARACKAPALSMTIH